MMMATAASSNRSAVNQSGERTGVSSVARTLSKRRKGGKTTRSGLGGTMRSSSQRAGSTIKPASIKG